MTNEPKENSGAVLPVQPWDDPDGLGWSRWRRAGSTGIIAGRIGRDGGRLGTGMFRDPAPIATALHRRLSPMTESAANHLGLDMPLYAARYPFFFGSGSAPYSSGSGSGAQPGGAAAVFRYALVAPEPATAGAATAEGGVWHRPPLPEQPPRQIEASAPPHPGGAGAVIAALPTVADLQRHTAAGTEAQPWPKVQAWNGDSSGGTGMTFPRVAADPGVQRKTAAEDVAGRAGKGAAPAFPAPAGTTSRRETATGFPMFGQSSGVLQAMRGSLPPPPQLSLTLLPSSGLGGGSAGGRGGARPFPFRRLSGHTTPSAAWSQGGESAAAGNRTAMEGEGDGSPPVPVPVATTLPTATSKRLLLATTPALSVANPARGLLPLSQPSQVVGLTSAFRGGGVGGAGGASSLQLPRISDPTAASARAGIRTVTGEGGTAILGRSTRSPIAEPAGHLNSSRAFAAVPMSGGRRVSTAGDTAAWHHAGMIEVSPAPATTDVAAGPPLPLFHHKQRTAAASSGYPEFPAYKAGLARALSTSAAVPPAEVAAHGADGGAASAAGSNAAGSNGSNAVGVAGGSSSYRPAAAGEDAKQSLVLGVISRRFWPPAAVGSGRHFASGAVAAGGVTDRTALSDAGLGAGFVFRRSDPEAGRGAATLVSRAAALSRPAECATDARIFPALRRTGTGGGGIFPKLTGSLSLSSAVAGAQRTAAAAAAGNGKVDAAAAALPATPPVLALKAAAALSVAPTVFAQKGAAISATWPDVAGGAALQRWGHNLAALSKAANFSQPFLEGAAQSDRQVGGEGASLAKRPHAPLDLQRRVEQVHDGGGDDEGAGLPAPPLAADRGVVSPASSLSPPAWGGTAATAAAPHVSALRTARTALPPATLPLSKVTATTSPSLRRPGSAQGLLGATLPERRFGEPFPRRPELIRVSGSGGGAGATATSGRAGEPEQSGQLQGAGWHDQLPLPSPGIETGAPAAGPHSFAGPAPPPQPLLSRQAIGRETGDSSVGNPQGGRREMPLALLRSGSASPQASAPGAAGALPAAAPPAAHPQVMGSPMQGAASSEAGQSAEQAAVDMEELVEKACRKIIRKLGIENERRGLR
jgi:hypothetical protein